MTTSPKTSHALRAASALIALLGCAALNAQTSAKAAAPATLPASAPLMAASAPKPPVAAFDWREQYAYAIGVQAYLYLYPWSYMPEARWTRTATIEHKPNRFHHVRHLEDANKTSGGAPNNDALYSRAWLYVKDEPVILTVPAIKNRYYTMEIVDFMGDNFDYVGQRTTGDKAGHYAIAAKGWKGKLPAGVKLLQRSSTPWAFIMGRTFVQDAADLPNVHAIQDQYKITPLSQWGKATPAVITYPEIWKPLDRKTDPLAEWKTISRTLTEVPTDPQDAGLMKTFSQIGLVPGADIDALDASTKRGLARAAVDGFRIVAQGISTGHLQKKVNGWNYPPAAIGRPTPTRDWLFRAMQMLAGFVANDPEEAIYLNVALDESGKPLSGDQKYEVRFAPGGQPKVKAFWSITMYNPQFNLVANPINRFSLGDRSAMKPNADGSLTMYLQKDSPGPDKESNWLPTPNGRFLMFMRTYLPGPDLLAQTWQPPKIVRLDPQ